VTASADDEGPNDPLIQGAEVDAAHRVSFREAFWVWVRVAAYSFGGPAGQIAVMQRILVDEKRWFSQNRFLHAMNYTMLLPGPEAQQLATYGGWMLHGWRGGLIAGGLFVLPGFVAIMVLSVLYAEFQDVTVVEALFFGIKPAVLAIVVEAVIRIGRRALKTVAMALVALAAFVAIFIFGVPFPIIIGVAALTAFLGRMVWKDEFLVIRSPDAEAGSPDEVRSIFHDDMAASRRPPIHRTVQTALMWLGIWWIPVVILFLVFGSSHLFVQEGVFFSKVAVVTFGGAYAVLAYIAQQAVEVHGWLAPGEMLDGLGMAETTPGPLIQVVQFVGFMGAYRYAGTVDPLIDGIIGSVITTWVTFAPCFLFIFVGAPYIEYLRGRESLSAALSGVTAAVVGVILNLALWFGIHTLFEETWTIGGVFELLVPEWRTVDLGALGIAGIAFVLLFFLRQGILVTLGVCAFLGVAYGFTIGL
jgi:chromate transporter